MQFSTRLVGILFAGRHARIKVHDISVGFPSEKLNENLNSPLSNNRISGLRYYNTFLFTET